MLTRFIFIIFILSSVFWLLFQNTDLFNIRLNKTVPSPIKIESQIITEQKPQTISHQSKIPIATKTSEQNTTSQIFKIEPSVVQTGEFIKVSVIGNIDNKSSIRIFSKNFPLFEESLHVFSTYIAIPLSAKPGDHELFFINQLPSNQSKKLVKKIIVLKKDRGFDYIKLSNTIISSSFSENAVQKDSLIRSQTGTSFSVGQYWINKFNMPAKGDISTMFGVGRSYNNQPVNSFHLGLDLAAGAGADVTAPAPGIIKWVGNSPIRGLTVYIDHGSGVVSSLSHLNDAYVQAGEAIKQNHLIGAVGSSGASTGPHLHWEVTVWGTHTDPLMWTKNVFSHSY